LPEEYRSSCGFPDFFGRKFTEGAAHGIRLPMPETGAEARPSGLRPVPRPEKTACAAGRRRPDGNRNVDDIHCFQSLMISAGQRPQPVFMKLRNTPSRHSAECVFSNS